MSEFKQLIETLQQSVIEDQFVKLTLSKPLKKSDGLLNVYMRLFVIEGKETFQLKFRHDIENQFKLVSLPEAISELELLLMTTFRAGTLFTLQEDLIVLVSKKKNVSYLENAPSFKNKLPETPLERE